MNCRLSPFFRGRRSATTHALGIRVSERESSLLRLISGASTSTLADRVAWLTAASFIASRVGNILAVLADTDSSLPDVRMPAVVACTSTTGEDVRPLASKLVGTVDGAAAGLCTGAS